MFPALRPQEGSISSSTSSPTTGSPRVVRFFHTRSTNQSSFLSYESRSQIINRNNDGISRWLEQQHNRRKEVLARTSGQLSILSFCGSQLARRQNKHSFLTRIQEARRANLPTPTETPNTSDGDHSPAEEPPD